MIIKCVYQQTTSYYYKVTDHLRNIIIYEYYIVQLFLHKFLLFNFFLTFLTGYGMDFGGQNFMHSIILILYTRPKLFVLVILQILHHELYGPVMLVFTLIALLLYQMKTADHAVVSVRYLQTLARYSKAKSKGKTFNLLL